MVDRRREALLDLRLLVPEAFDFALNTLDLRSFCSGRRFGSGQPPPEPPSVQRPRPDLLIVVKEPPPTLALTRRSGRRLRRRAPPHHE